MKIRYLPAVAAGLILFGNLWAQPVRTLPAGLAETLMESIEQRDGESGDYESMLRDLEDLVQHPVDLNTVRRDDLERFPFLTEFQINSLLDYRAEQGPFVSIYELAVIQGFNDDVIRLILPFVRIPDETADGVSLYQANRRNRHEVVFRGQRVVEPMRGYHVPDSLPDRSRYPGNPWLYYFRYGFESAGKISAGATFEKDAGEEFFSGTNPQGFDFNSAYVKIDGLGKLNTLLAGDFRLHFGQGLTLWNGSSPGKSALALNIAKRQDAIRPFTASDENDYFRGLAVSAGLGRFVLTLFGSAKRRDANLTDTLPTGKICFSSFQETGYHRTKAETDDEKSVRVISYGGHLLYRNNWLKTGLTVIRYTFDKSWQKSDALRDLYRFSGTDLTNIGLDYGATWNRFQFFGETAHGNEKWATLHGLVYHMNKFASFSLLYRNFQPGYFSLHSSAFSESSTDNNEEGFYLGAELHPAGKWTVTGYADYYRFPWVTYRAGEPSSGHEYLLQVNYDPDTKTSLLLRLRNGSDPRDEDDGNNPLPRVISSSHTGLRCNMKRIINKRLTVQGRAEMNRINSPDSQVDMGWMSYGDIQFIPSRIPARFDFRLAWFNTGSYDSRIYAYEQDLTAGFSFTPLYSKGYRTYLLIRYDLTPWLTLRFRIARTAFPHAGVMGSGLDQIMGSTRTDIKIQLTGRFH